MPPHHFTPLLRLLPIMGGLALVCSFIWFSTRNLNSSSSALNIHTKYTKDTSDISKYIFIVFDSTSTERYSSAYKHILKTLYEERNWQPIWFTLQPSSAIADTAMAVLSNVYRYGLLPQFYDVEQLTKEKTKAYSAERADEQKQRIALLDIQLTGRLIHLMRDLHFGKSKDYHDQKTDEWLCKQGLPLLNKAIGGNQFTKDLEQSQPTFIMYQQLQQALVLFLTSRSLDSTNTTIPDIKKDSLEHSKAVLKTLVQAGYILSRDTSFFKQEKLQQTLITFQQDYGLEADGKCGNKTRISLSRSNWDRFCQIAVNLDRLRKDTLRDSVFLLLNIPAFQLYVYENGAVTQNHRLIVGKPHTPTHPLSSQIHSIVIAPQWNVPYSIATKEMLPRIQASAGYLEKNNLQVFNKNGQMVDASTIEWNKLSANNFPYSIRQQQGCDNALGNLLFYFPNKYSTFLHDTPNRKLFNQVNRAMSHGCMRVEHPVELANFILSRNNAPELLDAAMVEKCQLNRQRKQINLKQPFPIHVRYLTCGTRNKQVVFYPDIYQHDKEDLIHFIGNR